MAHIQLLASLNGLLREYRQQPWFTPALLTIGISTLVVLVMLCLGLWRSRWRAKAESGTQLVDRRQSLPMGSSAPAIQLTAASSPHYFLTALQSGRMRASPEAVRSRPADPCLLALLSRAGVLEPLLPGVLQGHPVEALRQLYRLLDCYVPPEQRPADMTPVVAAAASDLPSSPAAASPASKSAAAAESQKHKKLTHSPPSLADLIAAGLTESVARRLLGVLLHKRTASRIELISDPAVLKRPTVPMEPEQRQRQFQPQQQQQRFQTPPPTRRSLVSPQSAPGVPGSPGMRELSQSVGQMRMAGVAAATPSPPPTDNRSAPLAQLPEALDVPETRDAPELRGRPLFQGWLQKRSRSGLLKRWQRRWFVLLGRWLLYYRSDAQARQQPRQPRGVLDLSQMVVLGPKRDSELVIEMMPLESLSVGASVRTAIKLRAADIDQAQEWLQRLIFCRHHVAWRLPIGHPVLGVSGRLVLGLDAELAQLQHIGSQPDAADGLFARFPPTEEELEHQDQIRQFRELVADTCGLPEFANQLYVKEVRQLDRACLRFLRARQFKPQVAAAMFREALEHRSRHGFDQLLQQPYLDVERIKPHYLSTVHGRDRFDRPIYIELIGRFDIPFLLDNFTMEDLLRYHVHMHEYLRQKIMTDCSRAAGRRVDQVTTILDLKGLGRKAMNRKALQFVQSIAQVDQLVYPELLGQSFIINVPALFAGIWKLIRPLLDERTKNKIRVVYGDPSEALLEVIEPDQLPKFLGGQCVCKPVPEGVAEESFGGCLAHSPLIAEYTKFAPLGSDRCPLGI